MDGEGESEEQEQRQKQGARGASVVFGDSDRVMPTPEARGRVRGNLRPAHLCARLVRASRDGAKQIDKERPCSTSNVGKAPCARQSAQCEFAETSFT